jgi:limonene-1,2-epoxide hydrolase
MSHRMTSNPITRRTTIAAGLAALAGAGPGPRLCASETNSSEKANIAAVNAFCAAWPSHDVDKIMSHFADNCAYRVTETQEPVKGRAAVRDKIKSFVNNVQKFEVLETFAKGPMVLNERIDHFSGGGLRSWHGVGMFFLKDGKIVEWYDYTIALERR